MARFLIEVELDESCIENEVSVFEDEGEEMEDTEDKSAEQWLEEEMGWVAQSGIHMIKYTELSETGRGYITADQLVELLKQKVAEREKAGEQCKEFDGKINYPYYEHLRVTLNAEATLLENLLCKHFPDEYADLVKKAGQKGTR